MSVEGRRVGRAMHFHAFYPALLISNPSVLEMSLNEMEMPKMAPSAQTLAGILPLLAVLIVVIVVTYIVWFKWEWLVQITLHSGRDTNPFFEIYEWFYTEGLGKWFSRIVFVPIMWLLVLYIFLHIVK